MENTPLHLAVLDNNIKSVWTVMKTHVDLNAKNKDQDTPLHLASKLHNLAAFQHIYRFGGKLNLVNSEGKTPLDYLSEKEKIYFSQFRDRFHGLGKYEYKPKPENVHHFGTNKEYFTFSEK